jgi:hypothetical protein
MQARINARKAGSKEYTIETMYSLADASRAEYNYDRFGLFSTLAYAAATTLRPG